MKRLLLIVLPLLLMVGCEDKKDDADDSNPIIGDWTVLSDDDCGGWFKVGSTILFNINGTFTYTESGESWVYDWSLAENTLTMELGNEIGAVTWSLEIGENTTKLKGIMGVSGDGTEYNYDFCTLTLLKS